MKQKQKFTETAIAQVFDFTQLQRFRQNRDLTAFDKSKTVPGKDALSSDSSDDSDSEDDQQVENQNQQNVIVTSSSNKLQSQRNQAK